MEAPDRWPWPATGSCATRWTSWTVSERHCSETLFYWRSFDQYKQKYADKTVVCFVFNPIGHLINDNNAPPNIWTLVHVKEMLLCPTDGGLSINCKSRFCNLDLMISDSNWFCLKILWKTSTEPTRSVLSGIAKKEKLELENSDQHERLCNTDPSCSFKH